MTLDISRRTAMTAAALGATTWGVTSGATQAAAKYGTPGTQPRTSRPLKFSPNGTFKVIQFNDTQDDEATDQRTLQLINAALDHEKPDFVVINGDVINGECDTETQVKEAYNQVVQPMEARRIPWAITLGNHDEDSAATTGMTETRIIEFLRTYPHNRNTAPVPGVTGHTNSCLLVAGSRNAQPQCALWLIDTGRYAPKTLNGQSFDGLPDWDWVRADQVQWYRATSQALENRYGRKIPGLMWGHIALHEHRNMWFASLDDRTPTAAALGQRRHNITGERNEDECPGPINSGLFSAFLERGDIKSYFVGHDHVNTYAGNYYGVMLGYAPGTGFGAYGLEGEERNRLRGARVFELIENATNPIAATRLIFASDYGIDLTANDQSTPPAPLPKKYGQNVQ